MLGNVDVALGFRSLEGQEVGRLGAIADQESEH